MTLASDRHHPDSARAEHRRRQVLEAAEQCFRRRGFHGASMADISKAAGMSAGHIYNYFDNKEAIIAAFVQCKVERVSAIMRDLDSHADPLQALLDGMDEYVRKAVEDDDHKIPLEIFAEAARNPAIHAMLCAADEHTRGQFQDVVCRARERRGLSVDRAVIGGRVAALIAMFEGLHLRVLQHPQLMQRSMADALRTAAAPLLLND